DVQGRTAAAAGGQRPLHRIEGVGNRADVEGVEAGAAVEGDRRGGRQAQDIEDVRAAAAFYGQARGAGVGDRRQAVELHRCGGDGVGGVGAVGAVVDGERPGIEAVDNEPLDPGGDVERVRAGARLDGVRGTRGRALDVVGRAGVTVEGEGHDIAV